MCVFTYALVCPCKHVPTLTPGDVVEEELPIGREQDFLQEGRDQSWPWSTLSVTFLALFPRVLGEVPRLPLQGSSPTIALQVPTLHLPGLHPTTVRLPKLVQPRRPWGMANAHSPLPESST